MSSSPPDVMATDWVVGAVVKRFLLKHDRYRYLHDDLIQAGRVGLLESVHTFDPEGASSFTTWAYFRVAWRVGQEARAMDNPLGPTYNAIPQRSEPPMLEDETDTDYEARKFGLTSTTDTTPMDARSLVEKVSKKRLCASPHFKRYAEIYVRNLMGEQYSDLSREFGISLERARQASKLVHGAFNEWAAGIRAEGG